MDNIKNDEYYLNKMMNNLNRINEIMVGISYDQYVSDINLQEMIMFNLIQISENVKKLSDEYKNKHKDIPWIEIYGLRNRIVHGYGSVVLDIVYSALVEDIPILRDSFLKNK